MKIMIRDAATHPHLPRLIETPEIYVTNYIALAGDTSVVYNFEAVLVITRTSGDPVYIVMSSVDAEEIMTYMLCHEFVDLSKYSAHTFVSPSEKDRVRLDTLSARLNTQF